MHYRYSDIYIAYKYLSFNLQFKYKLNKIYFHNEKRFNFN